MMSYGKEQTTVPEMKVDSHRKPSFTKGDGPWVAWEDVELTIGGELCSGGLRVHDALSLSSVRRRYPACFDSLAPGAKQE